MNNKPCIACNKPMNGGVYRYPNKCPHCGAIQDGSETGSKKKSRAVAKKPEFEVVEGGLETAAFLNQPDEMIVEEIVDENGMQLGDMDLHNEDFEIEYEYEEVIEEEEIDEDDELSDIEYFDEMEANNEEDDAFDLENAFDEDLSDDALVDDAVVDDEYPEDKTVIMSTEKRIELVGAEIKNKIEDAKKRAHDAEVKSQEEIEAEEAIRKAEEAKKKAEEARIQAEKEREESLAAEKAAEEERLAAEKKAEAARKKKAEAEAKRKAEEEAKLKAEEAAKKKAEEAKKKAEAEAKRKAEEAKKKAEAEAQKKAELEAKKKADLKRKAELEAKKKSDAAKKAREKVAELRVAEKATRAAEQARSEYVYELNLDDRVESVAAGTDVSGLSDKARELELLESKKLKSITITTETAHDIEILKRHDVVTGECVLGMHVFKDLFSGSAAFSGGKSSAAQNGLKYAKNAVLDELRREALALGANAVVGVNIEFSEISNGEKNMLFVVATGTAVDAVL